MGEPPKKWEQVVLGVLSPDRPTRRMAILFWLSVGLFCAVFSISVIHFEAEWKERRSRPVVLSEAARHQEELLKLKEEESSRKDSTIEVGDFELEIKPPAQRSNQPGEMNMAQLTLVLVCDNKETTEFVHTHLDQVRNEITSVLVAIDRDRLLSRDGKAELKRSILDRLNSWMRSGKIEAVYFSRLLIN